MSDSSSPSASDSDRSAEASTSGAAISQAQATHGPDGGQGAGSGTRGGLVSGPGVGAGVGAGLGPGLGWLSGPLCLALLTGLALPPQFGLLPPLALVAIFAVVGERRVRMVLGGLPRLREASVAARFGALALVVLAAGLMLTMTARGVASLVVEFPATLWGLAAALGIGVVWLLVGRRLPARARPVVLLLLAGLVPFAGIHGARHEAAGANARGWAHSGPVLGIHPFQITSVMVDGHGPYDLPINDYVEPDGSRGYGPEALGDVIERSLHAIAERAYADGPARVRRAFADAEVEVVETPSVWERLDREPNTPTQPRFIVRSGSTGTGSRVEFVCPGRRIDPRGPKGESVMNRMCPDKYASEASAGLGVTGRWSGYSEGRGSPRTGLAAWYGWTRTDDAKGREVIERETRWWAVAVLATLGLLMIGPLRAASDGIRGTGGALGVLAVGVLVVLAFSAASVPAVSAWESGASWASWTELRQWTPALALGGMALFAFEPSAAARGSSPRFVVGGGESRAVFLVAVLVGVVVIAVASALPALAWVVPFRGPHGAALPSFVQGVAEAFGERGGFTIFQIEGAMAAGLGVLLLGGAASFLSVVWATAQELRPTDAPTTNIKPLVVTAAAVVVALAIGAALVVSRKTAGAVALMPGVVGMTLVLGSSLLRISQPPRRKALALVIHLTWTAIGLALVWSAVQPLPLHPFVVLCAAFGVLGVLGASLTSIVIGPRPEKPSVLEHGGN